MKELTIIGELVNKQTSQINQYNSDLKRQQDVTKEKRGVVLKFAQDVHKIVQT
jgi:hypothetical protein